MNSTLPTLKLLRTEEVGLNLPFPIFSRKPEREQLPEGSVQSIYSGPQTFNIDKPLKANTTKRIRLLSAINRNTMKIFKWILACLIFPIGMQAQTITSLKQTAKDAYDAGDYYNALEVAQEVLAIEENNAEYLFIAGKSAFQLRAYPIVERRLKWLINLDENNQYPEAYLVLAKTYYALGQYSKVLMYCNDLINKEFGTEIQKEQARKIADNCEWAMEKCMDVDPYITVSKLSKTVNTKYSDFPIAYSNNNLQYATMVIPKEEDSACDCVGPCDYHLDWNRINLSSNQKADSINFPGTVDKMRYFTFAGRNHRVYYVDCNCDNKSGDNCALYYRVQTADNNWSDPR